MTNCAECHTELMTTGLSRVRTRSNGETTRGALRIVIVDGGPVDAQRARQAARAAGIDSPAGHWSTPGECPAGSALLFEARAPFDLARRCLRAVREDVYFDTTPALLSVTADQLASMEGAEGFDDFVLDPCDPLEVRTRIRAVELRRRAAAGGRGPEPDGIVVDPIEQEAQLDGRTVSLTARELALLAYLRTQPGRVLSRQHLLLQVWGHRYRGGPRTVDTHIGRLRLKLGAALPIETVRSRGYRLLRAATPAAGMKVAAGDPNLEAPSLHPPGLLACCDAATHSSRKPNELFSSVRS